MICDCPSCRARDAARFERIVAPIRDEMEETENRIVSEFNTVVERIRAYQMR